MNSQTDTVSGVLALTGAHAMCRACSSADLQILYTARDIPVHSALLLDNAEQAASFPTGDLQLVWCPRCGFASNALFDASRTRYGDGYEESQGCSPTFMNYARALAQGWIDRYQINGRKLLEIGCGKGEFLRLICELAQAEGIGFDPAYDPARTQTNDAPQLQFRREFFGSEHVPVDADFIICRHTLEHIPDVDGFGALMARACAGRRHVTLGFELPDFARVLDELAFWDIYYEHCSYFTAEALIRLFQRHSFEIVDLRYVYGDQYLVIEARCERPGHVPEPIALENDLNKTRKRIDRFLAEGVPRIEAWRQLAEGWRRTGQTVVLWGSGSKAVGFLTTIGVAETFAAVVDINPFRHGRYMPGCTMPIVAPDQLAALGPDIVIIMNPVYRAEIAAQIAGLNIRPALFTVADPVEDLLETVDP